MHILSIPELLFVVIFSVNMVYWLGFLRVLFYKYTGKEKQAQPISIVVCAWNEKQNLTELLPLLLSQDHPDYEIIIVDDRSQDGTYDFLVKARDSHQKVKIVRVDQVPDHINAKKFAVTLGIKAAQNDLILHTDADCRPLSNSWAREMSGSFGDETIFVLGYSPYQFGWSLLNVVIQYETLITGIHYLSAALWKSPYMGVGRNMAYRKSFFLSQKGFIGIQGVLGGDDDLFVNRHANGKNTVVCVSPGTIVESIPKKSWDTYLKQKKRHYGVGKHYKIKDKFRLGLFSFSQIMFWICFVTLALLKINPYLIAGGFGIRLLLQLLVTGIGAGKLKSKFPVFLLPFADLLYTCFVPAIGIPGLLSKKNKWR